MVQVAILTVSDRVSQGLAEDRSGPALAELVKSVEGWEVVDKKVCPDEPQPIQHAIKEWSDGFAADLIITTGGTGFGVRDVTPEAIRPLLDKEAPGLTTAMLTSSLAITPMASLSRPICGVRKNSIIITLPGSVKGSTENLQSILPVLGHAIELCKGGKDAGESTHAKMVLSVENSAAGKSKGHHLHHHHHHHGHQHHHHHHESGETKGTALEERPLPMSGELNAAVKSRARKSPYPMAEFDDALETALKHAKRLDPIKRKVEPDLAGFVIAEDVVSPEAVPAFRASIVDGYAVVATDGPGTYLVAGNSKAGGQDSKFVLQPGQISRVTTGAPVPEGATAVIMVEDTVLVEDEGDDEKRVKILSRARAGQNIREPGSDISVGEVVVSRGDIVSASGGEVGLLASVGVKEVSVYGHPTVAILSTGDELVPYDQPGPLTSGMVRDTNLPSLTTALSRSMPSVKVVGINTSKIETDKSAVAKTAATVDIASSLEASFRKALSVADVIITTGGVSMGEADLVKPVLERALGATVWFGRVRLKPGKPTTFATVPVENGSEKLVFSLPGNPVSALVCFSLFVLPCLRKMAGYESPRLPIVLTELAHPVTLDPRPEFFRARVVVDTKSDSSKKDRSTRLVAHGTGSQLSSRMLSMRGANALLRLPALEDAKVAGVSNAQGGLDAGQVVEAYMIGEL
ncbi:hypothetical protein HDU97_003835 [Phlyctochytrium planicorne]|nr:hypothetical protein HDU97_003835 [Phlyctochytrium planicorne]